LVRKPVAGVLALYWSWSWAPRPLKGGDGIPCHSNPEEVEKVWSPVLTRRVAGSMRTLVKRVRTSVPPPLL
jgi:hypothetical protein